MFFFFLRVWSFHFLAMLCPSPPPFVIDSYSTCKRTLLSLPFWLFKSHFRYYYLCIMQHADAVPKLAEEVIALIKTLRHLQTCTYVFFIIFYHQNADNTHRYLPHLYLYTIT